MMLKRYEVTLSATVTTHYRTREVFARNAAEAEEMAKDMFCDGELSMGEEMVDRFQIDISRGD